MDYGRRHDRAASSRDLAEGVENAASRAQTAGTADGPVPRQQAAADVGECPEVVCDAAAQSSPGEDMNAGASVVVAPDSLVVPQGGIDDCEPGGIVISATENEEVERVVDGAAGGGT